MACHGFLCEDHCAFYHADDHGANLKGFRRCKNPDHKNFMTVDEFVQKGPVNLIGPSREDLCEIWDVIYRTVRIRLSKTSTNRPDTFKDSKIPYPLKELRGNSYYTRYGTGYLVKSAKIRGDDDNKLVNPCPCFACKTAKNQLTKLECSRYFVISTATHVVFDQQEAESAVIDLFYDSEDRKTVETIYGVSVLGDEATRLETDRCQILCVTHDYSLAEKLSIIAEEKLYLTRSNLRNDILVSHPHGVSKRISCGNFTSAKRVVLAQKEAPIVLKKGLKIRISGTPADDSEMTRTLDLKREDDGDCWFSPSRGPDRKTFRIMRDVTVSFPLRIAVEHDVENEDFVSEDRWGEGWCKNRWWTLPPGIEFITGKGDHFSLPFVPGDVEKSLKMEVYVDDSLYETTLIRFKDNDTFQVFMMGKSYYNYYTYDMAACKGSSGGPVINRQITCPPMSKEIATHFGSLGKGSMSGLVENFLHDKISHATRNVVFDLENHFPFLKKPDARKYVLGGISPCHGISFPLKLPPSDEFASILKTIFPTLKMERFWSHLFDQHGQTHFSTNTNASRLAAQSQREEAENKLKRSMLELISGGVRCAMEQQLKDIEFPDNLVHEFGLWSYFLPARDLITKLWKTQLLKLCSILMAEKMKRDFYPPSFPPDGDRAETNLNLLSSIGDLLVVEMEKDCSFVIPKVVKDRMVDILYDDSDVSKNGVLVLQSNEIFSDISGKMKTMMDCLPLIMALSEMHKDCPSPALQGIIRDMSQMLFDDFFISSNEALPGKSKHESTSSSRATLSKCCHGVIGLLTCCYGNKDDEDTIIII